MIRRRRRPIDPFWARELVELGALFLAAALAHLFSSLVEHQPFGPTALVVIGVAVIIGALIVRRWLARYRANHAVPRPRTPRGKARSGRAWRDYPSLWLIRTAVEDRPGRLAVLTGVLGALGCDIRTLQVHIGADGPVDEFLVHAPADISPERLVKALHGAGGREVKVLPAETHDLVDGITSALGLAGHLVDDPDTLPVALARLLAARVSVRPESDEPIDVVDGTTLRLAHQGGVLVLERPRMPFTTNEFARAKAMVDLSGYVRALQAG